MASTYSLSNSLLDEWFGKITPTIPTNYYIGLSTTTVQNDGTGATEPTDTAYARVALPNNKVSFSTSSLGSLSNAIQFTFPQSLISWGTITYFFLSDSLTGGSIKAFGALTYTRNVEVATVLVLEIGAMVISIQNIV